VKSKEVLQSKPSVVESSEGELQAAREEYVSGWK
jgi:hypothetical protein